MVALVDMGALSAPRGEGDSPEVRATAWIPFERISVPGGRALALCVFRSVGSGLCGSTGCGVGITGCRFLGSSYSTVLCVDHGLCLCPVWGVARAARTRIQRSSPGCVCPRAYFWSRPGGHSRGGLADCRYYQRECRHFMARAAGARSDARRRGNHAGEPDFAPRKSLRREHARLPEAQGHASSNGLFRRRLSIRLPHDYEGWAGRLPRGLGARGIPG